jgi:phenylalanyl-tRNA synthetase beta chain
MTVGKELPVETRSRTARNILIGVGYTEVLNLTLTSKKRNFDDLRLERDDDIVLISNPVSPQITMLRTHLLPGILETFENNREYELPQKIFEIGDVSHLDKTAETGAAEQRKIAGAIIGSKAGFADIRSVVERLLHEYDHKLAVKPMDHPTFIPGRTAEIRTIIDKQEKPLGVMGEIHPDVLGNFSLIYPVAAFEIVLP